MKRLAFVLGLAIPATISMIGCAPPPPAPVAPGPAADNGQPKMQAALQALQGAQAELNQAEPNKGGFREQALQAVAQAIDQVNQGMQYAAAHPTEQGEAEGPAEPEPVDEDVRGAENQPHMAKAVEALREARRQLKDAKHDKGGFRKQAMASVNQAIELTKRGIAYSDHHE